MKHLTPVNRKAARVEAVTKDVVALQQPPQQPEPPHIPNGCSLVFSPGWEADRNGGTAGLCQPVERDGGLCTAETCGRRDAERRRSPDVHRDLRRHHPDLR